MIITEEYQITIASVIISRFNNIFNFMFNKCYKPFAFFELYNGLGWKTEEGEFVITTNNTVVKNTFPEALNDSLTRQGKAYMQYHFDLFNKY